MQIVLQQVSPTFLEPEKINGSALWKRDTIFSKGERIQVVAPSGSGKTSLIHFLYGLRNDFNGNILFGNRNSKTFTAEEKSTLRSNKLSIVFQDLRLFADHTARENVSIKRLLNPFSNGDHVLEMAEKLGIANKLDQLAGTCSYGEQQRIAIIRALQQPFEFIVLDEPFSHLDEANSRKAMALIDEEVQKRGAGIILADLSEVAFFEADRTIKL